MTRIAPRLLACRLYLQRLFHISDWQSMLLWAVAAGLLGAAATEGFRILLNGLDVLVLGQGGSLVAIAKSLPIWVRCMVPAVGGALAGLLLMLARRTPTQSNGSDYMEAVVLGDGRIPVAHTLARTGSSLVSIASGGSIGREGSMVQLAAMCASLLGQRLHFPVERLRLLVACGAAAGITSAYNAPIAGAFFIAEIVLGSIAMESVGPILIASVVANIAMRALSGGDPPYAIPSFPAVPGIEVGLFAVLGVLLGAGAALFLKGLGSARDRFNRLPVALPWRLALGGLIVGLISIRVPEVWGNGYSVVNAVLHSPWHWEWLLVVVVAKALATLSTAGSGAVGGVFTPALFFGCLLGELFGQGVHMLWPQSSATLAYAVAGMGAFLAGATQAPLMAILMIFEMTLSHQVMLPLMASCVPAYFVARSLRAGSMYRITAHREEQRDEKLRLRMLQVRDLVQPADTVVGPDTSLDAMSRLFLKYPVKYLYVVDEKMNYLGVVPLKALGAAEGSTADRQSRRAADFLSLEITPLHEDMNLGQALQRFMEHRGERLPVVRHATDPVLLGTVSKTALLQTYVRLSNEASIA